MSVFSTSRTHPISSHFGSARCWARLVLSKGIQSKHQQFPDMHRKESCLKSTYKLSAGVRGDNIPPITYHWFMGFMGADAWRKALRKVPYGWSRGKISLPLTMQLTHLFKIHLSTDNCWLQGCDVNLETLKPHNRVKKREKSLHVAVILKPVSQLCLMLASSCFLHNFKYSPSDMAARSGRNTWCILLLPCWPISLWSLLFSLQSHDPVKAGWECVLYIFFLMV